MFSLGLGLGLPLVSGNEGAGGGAFTLVAHEDSSQSGGANNNEALGAYQTRTGGGFNVVNTNGWSWVEVGESDMTFYWRSASNKWSPQGSNGSNRNEFFYIDTGDSDIQREVEASGHGRSGSAGSSTNYYTIWDQPGAAEYLYFRLAESGAGPTRTLNVVRLHPSDNGGAAEVLHTQTFVDDQVYKCNITVDGVSIIVTLDDVEIVNVTRTAHTATYIADDLVGENASPSYFGNDATVGKQSDKVYLK